MEKITFERLCIIDDDYSELGPVKLAELIEEGKALIELHGEDNLQYKLKTEAEMVSVGAFLDWKTATNDENYEDPS